ncbi:hypothetical protein [Hymenobacter sp. UYCo722]|uniref:hypothetical protein n=1 Tax=Hymenobacter sp. UYCo722 TaxID=3156335 RepID=UPI00339139F1
MKSILKNAVCVAAAPFLLAACSSPNQPTSEGAAPSPASAAEMALMATHDSLMFQTDELMALKGKLSGYHSEAPAPYIHGLAAADNAMMAWMHQYKASDSAATPASRLAYLQQQQQVLAGVRRLFRSSLDSATKFQAQHPAAGDVRPPTSK